MPVTIKDVAKRAGVSSATVSRVLADKPYTSSEVKRRVLNAVEALGYRPNRTARSLRVRRSSVIGLILSDIQNPFFNAVVRAVEDTLYGHGYGVLLCNSDEDVQREQLYLDLFLDEQVSGVILTPTRGDAKAYEALLSAEIPFTVIDRYVTALEVDTVVTNNAEAASDVVERLIRGGHERIGAIFSDLSISTGRERLEGYKNALRRANLPFDPSLVRFGRPVHSDGYQLVGELLRESAAFTGLFTGSKLLTLGALRYLYEHDISLDALALGAFDALDWLPNQPEMIVAEQPAYKLGETAAQLLLGRIGDPNKATEHVILNSSIARIGSSYNVK